MLQQKIRPLNKVNLPVGFDEIVTNRLHVVNDNHLNPFVLYPLSQVDEHFIIVLQCLTMGENDVLTDLLLRNFVLILHQKEFFYLIKSLLV